MKVLTLNLWNGGRLLEKALPFLQQQAADIYFLQEAYDGKAEHLEPRFRTVEILKQTFSTHYAYFSATYLDTRGADGKIGDGQLLLSRWPLNRPEMLFFDVPFGEYDQDATVDFSHFPAAAQKASITVDGKNITLLNVHGPVNNNGAEDSARRQAMRQTLLNNLGEYSIVAGDFNVPHTSVTYQVLEQQLTNVFKDKLTTTFSLGRKDLVKYPGYATAAVDSIFVTPNFKVVATQAPDVDISDHRPLIAEVEF